MAVIIKRYRNRKLYNTQSKSYITLEEIGKLIKQQKEIKVIDNESENDITATTLSQIIYSLEKNQAGLLPIDLLISLVQSGGKRMDDIRRNLINSLNLSHYYDVEIERRVNYLVANGDFDQEASDLILKKLLSVGIKYDDLRENVEKTFVEFFRERQIPSKSDFQLFINRIESLSKKIEGFEREKLDLSETNKEV